jgi:UDP-N-acetylmuramoylalanine--D-glutamate ligase
MEISLFGYGKTTKAISKIKTRYKFVFYEKGIKEFKDDKNIPHKPFSDFDSTASSFQIPSPGIPPYEKVIKKAENLISEYDFFLSDTILKRKKPFSIWISGTNGKTTTTQMTNFLFNSNLVQAGGNIGIPLGEMDSEKKIWILETSSFTLHYTKVAKPNIYVLLPLLRTIYIGTEVLELMKKQN